VCRDNQVFAWVKKGIYTNALSTIQTFNENRGRDMGANQKIDPIEKEEEEARKRKDVDIQQMRLDILRRQSGGGQTLG
jgi:hypothetical protein